MIQDFWHVCEHLAQLSKDLYGERWRERFLCWKQALRASRIETILAHLREERERFSGHKRKRIDAEIGYLESGKHRMDYAGYEREGWPIGSGAIRPRQKLISSW